MDCMFSASMDDIFTKKLQELTLYEKVLFRKKEVAEGERREYVSMEMNEWLECCREYAKKTQEERKTDKIKYIGIWTVGNLGKCLDIIKDYNRLKKCDPELFDEIFTVPFAMQLLHEVITTGIDSEANKNRIIRWSVKNVPKTVTEKDFWEYIEKRVSPTELLDDYFNAERELDFAQICKKYFNLKLVPDLKNSIHKKYLERLLSGMQIARYVEDFNTCYWELNTMYDCKSELLNLFSIFDGFKGNRMSTFRGLTEELIKAGDKEVLHAALVKNFISHDMVKKSLECIWEEGKLELISLFLLKKYGEWNEEL